MGAVKNQIVEIEETLRQFDDPGSFLSILLTARMHGVTMQVVKQVLKGMQKNTASVA